MLPIDHVIPEILERLQSGHRLVVQAPPGAGKTTRLPLALLDQPWLEGRILLIQPRRLAVYGAARRLAAQLGEPVGQRVGYRTRFDSRVSPATRIEVITEGIFLRLIQDDPELTGVSAVIFDEFHERAVSIDLGLAFALDTQTGLRDDTQPLRLIVMSATLDGESLSRWLDAPWVASEGRMFPVATRYCPVPAGQWPDRHIADVIERLLREEDGNLLVFLPGMREIRRTQTLLEERALPTHVQIHALHASLPPEAQEAAIAPAPAGLRKIVLSTNVAETSVTIEGIRVVIDSGLVRVSLFDERRGMDNLATERISQASAEQRRGRAGRLMPGVCVRLWGESEHASLRRFSEPDILRCDLMPVALELAVWGARDPAALTLATPPPAEAFARARETLMQLDALDDQGRVTALGRQLSSLPLSPRLAHLVWQQRSRPAALAAIVTAAVLTDGDPLRTTGPSQSDIGMRLQLWQRGPDGSVHRSTWQRLQQTVRQLSDRVGLKRAEAQIDADALGGALAAAFPDRVAQRRADAGTRYLMANGRGVQLAREDRLAGEEYLVVLDTDGAGHEPRVTLAATVTRRQIDTALAAHLERGPSVRWNGERRVVEAEARVCLGAIVLERRHLPQPWPAQAQTVLLEAVAASALALLPWSDAARGLQARVQWLRETHPEAWPDVSDAALTTELAAWLGPFLEGVYSASALAQVDLCQALRHHLGWDRQQALDRAAPVSWPLPTGETRSLDYAAENGPVLRARMQELFGLREHPTLPDGKRLLVEILSPAHRPLQVTRDLPGFWAGSYRDVAKEMRGRYPKHLWPERPEETQATTRTKRHLQSQ